MARDHQTLRWWYRRLVALYPREFRELLGDSMERTFADLCRERSERGGQRFGGYVLWLFAETAAGAGREHILIVREGTVMRGITADLRWSALLGLLIVLPFAGLEYTVAGSSTADASLYALFGVLWVLATAFLVTLGGIVRKLRTGGSAWTHPFKLLVAFSFLLAAGFVWWGIVLDQLPCFLGVPNCD